MTHRPPLTPSASPPRFTRRHTLGMAGASLATVTAGRRPARAQPATPAATPTSSGPLAGAVPADRVALAVERLSAIARAILAQTGVPGMAVAVVAGDTVVALEGFGLREVGKAAPIEPDTVFQLASVSKSLAATTVAAVVGDGHVTWEARLADLAPGFALPDAWPTEHVTVADLFAHRSGLPDVAGDVLEDLGFSADEIIHRLRYLEPAYSFRAGYAYTNFGLSAAAYAVAHAAGTSWADLCAQRLYRPLGMAHTSSRFADYLAQPNRAIPHVQAGDHTWKVTPLQRDPDAQSPAGGVSTTARDLAQWVRLQLGGGTIGGQRLIPAEALAPMHTPQSVRGEPTDPATQRASFYGLGVDLDYTSDGAVQWSHSGAFALGAGTAYYLLPGSRVGVLALTNAYPVGAAEAVCLSVLDLVRNGTLTQDWLALLTPLFAAMGAPRYGTELGPGKPVVTGPALPLAAYTGTYHNAFYGPAEVAVVGGQLVLRLGPKPLEFPLTPLGRDSFTWTPVGENAFGDRSGLVFTVGPNGQASALTDDYLTSGGPGTLVRVR